MGGSLTSLVKLLAIPCSVDRLLFHVLDDQRSSHEIRARKHCGAAGTEEVAVMICPEPLPCQNCGDKLIHQANRGRTESSSALGQYVNGKFAKDFWWLDIDGVIYRKETRILRIIEHKYSGQSLTRGQREVLPLLAKSVQLLATGIGLVDSQSGVFVVHSDGPFSHACIKQVKGWTGLKVPQTFDLADQPWDAFLRGEEMS